MLNDEIRKFKCGDDRAFENIIKIMNKDINNIVYKYNIPGKEKEDLVSIAMEEVLDCIRERQLKRGKGIKKTINENDLESKNRNFIKAAINYRLMRELRGTKTKIRVSYDIPFLQENGDNYKDRKGKPLYVGAIFYNNKAYLIEKMKNTKLILNLSQNYINRNVSTCEMKNPIDASLSFDTVVDDDDNEHEIRDVLEFGQCRLNFYKDETLRDMKLAASLTNNRIIKEIVSKSTSEEELKDYVKHNKKNINKIKCYLKEVLL